MQQEQQFEDEISLIDILQVLWKRKIMIISMTLLLTIAAGGVSMMLPKIYEITAIIEPAKNAEGNPVEAAEVIKENILGGAYDQEIQSSLNLTVDKFPTFKVQIPKNTTLLKVSIESADPEQSVVILNELLATISLKIEDRLQQERQKLENAIKLAIVNHKALQGRLKLLTIQTGDTADKIKGLEAARNQALGSRTSDAMSVLLYSNEIQNQQIYQNDLQLQLEDTRKEIDTAALAVDRARLTLTQVKGTNINKIPLVPEKPIKPKKRLIVVLVFMVGAMGSVLLAFLLEYISNARPRMNEVNE